MNYLPRLIPTLFIVYCFLGMNISMAQETELSPIPTQVLDHAPQVQAQEQDSQITQDPWKAFIPPPDDAFDWIQLVSGEWLKGEIKAMYNYELEFKSDELDLLKLDWDDVRQIRSGDYQSLYIEQGNKKGRPITVVGIVEMVYDKVSVTANGNTQTFNRNDIISIAEGSDKEINLWSGELSLGANARSGNTKLVDINIIADAKRRSAKSRYSLQYFANYARTQGVDTSNNQRVTTFFDLFTSSRFFWRTFDAEFYRDTFKNIDRQISIGTGFGFELVRTSKTEWSVIGGVGALRKRYVSVLPGQDPEISSPVLSLGTRLDTDITKRIEYLFDYNAQISNDKAGRYTHHMISTLSTDLNSYLDLDISLVWDRINKPQERDDGTIPYKNDYQLIVGVSYEL
jgi:hypothetical protein